MTYDYMIIHLGLSYEIQSHSPNTIHIQTCKNDPANRKGPMCLI